MRVRFLAVVIVAAAGLATLLTGTMRAGDAASPATVVALPASGSATVAFYFHGNARCVTCRTIEAYADEAIHAGFPEALADGKIEWRAVNVDEPANRHFIQDFQLVTRSVVLAEYRDGKIVRSKNLDQVWQLVRNKQRFVDYVQSETKAFLAAG